MLMKDSFKHVLLVNCTLFHYFVTLTLHVYTYSDPNPLKDCLTRIPRNTNYVFIGRDSSGFVEHKRV